MVEIFKPKSTEELIIAFCEHFNIDKDISKRRLKKQMKLMLRHRYSQIPRHMIVDRLRHEIIWETVLIEAIRKVL